MGEAAKENLPSHAMANTHHTAPALISGHQNQVSRQHHSASIAAAASETSTPRHGRERIPDRRAHSHSATRHKAPMRAANASVGSSRMTAAANGVTSRAVTTRCFKIFPW